MPEWSRIRNRVLKKVKPTSDEERETERFVKSLMSRLGKTLSTKGIQASVEIHGSVSRGTWLQGERDIDIFIVLDPSIGRAGLHTVNDAVKQFLGSGWTEAYAEHPYVKSVVNGFDVEFIPCFRAKLGGSLVSSVDRTPLHTLYLKERLRRDQVDDVRLLKRFMRGVGVYGAEIRVGGFSGYLCELLILFYGGFREAVTSVSRWVDTPVMQLEGMVEEEKLRKKFHEPLIVIDPVDHERNVASAVKERTLWELVAACRAFSEKPDLRFFFPNRKKVTPSKVLRLINSRGLDMVFVTMSDPEPPVPDTLWGQLFRTEEAIARALKEKEFNVVRSASWSDEKSRHLLIFELESSTLPKTMKRQGPPVAFQGESRRFIETYEGSEKKVSGPGIDGSRWWVEVGRRHTNAVEYLKEVLLNGGEHVGLPRSIGTLMKESGRVLMNKEINPNLTEGLNEYLYKFMDGRPDWLG